jgi:putative transposase
MKKKRFSVEQITSVLQQVESGIPVGDVCRQVGVSEQTFYRWNKAYGSMLPSEARELKQLRDENTKLNRLVADLLLDKVMLQDVVQKSSKARQEARNGALLDGPILGQRTPGDTGGALLSVQRSLRRLSGRDVVGTLERLSFERDLPQRIYCDNGTKFVNAAMDLWAHTNGVILDFSRRGKPTDNAAVESFNGGSGTSV